MGEHIDHKPSVQGWWRRRRRHPVSRPVAGLGGGILGMGVAALWLSIIVLLPLAAVVWESAQQSREQFWSTVTSPVAMSSLKFTLAAAGVVAVIAAFMGTLIAWVLVRDSFPGKRIVNMAIDLPFALPTIVAGLTLLALYGPQSHIANITFTRASVVAALLFVTLPFVVRSVQPVLIEFDREMEEAAASLGASSFTTFRRIILPNLMPAILTGAGLSFAKAVGEFGSVVLISGNIPFKTQVASVYIFSEIESDNPSGAAAVSMVLLVVAMLVLAAMSFVQRRFGGSVQ